MKNPLSVHARLLLIAGVTGLAALLFAALAIGNVLRDAVLQGLDAKIDAQIRMLERAIGPNGRIDPSKLISLQGFDGTSPGWGWRVENPAGEWAGGEPILDVRMYSGRRHDNWMPKGPSRELPIGRAGSGNSPTGTRLFLRRVDVIVGGTVTRITAAGPRHVAEQPLREAYVPLLTTLLLLGLALGLATWAQLRVGLKPLRDLRDAVARIRNGEAEYVPEPQPKELRPLVSEVNALIDQNASGLGHARAHVANLAHGLKTPLATLALKLERENASDESRALVAQLDKRIAHHLRRARTASTGTGDRVRTALEPVIGDLFLAMAHIHADRRLGLEHDLEDGLLVAIDREDLDEMLGNLLDNACRHARSNVSISAQANGQLVVMKIDDDGPGIAEDRLAEALHPGTRLDETGTGYGFGLAIVRELAELYGGSLHLGLSQALGGLSAVLALPRQT